MIHMFLLSINGRSISNSYFKHYVSDASMISLTIGNQFFGLKINISRWFFCRRCFRFIDNNIKGDDIIIC